MASAGEPVFELFPWETHTDLFNRLNEIDYQRFPGNVDIDKFVPRVGRVAAAYWLDNYGEKLSISPDQGKYILGHDFHEKIDENNPYPSIPPSIRYAIIRREPGSFDTKPFREKKMYRPRLRFYIKENSQVYSVKSMWWDNLVRFNAYSKDITTELTLLHRFEDFLRKKMALWYALGASRVVLFGRMEESRHIIQYDDTSQAKKIGTFVFVRTEEFTIEEPDVTIEDIRIAVAGESDILATVHGINSLN